MSGTQHWARDQMTFVHVSAQRAHVQADLGIDHDLLRSGQPVGIELGVQRHVALEQGQRDRTQLVVAGRAADEADLTARR